MSTISHIPVAKEFSKTLNSREAASMLIKKMLENLASDIELDFSQVEFMSRSFADQFYKEESQLLEREKISIHFLNANEEILKILDLVSRTQNKSERDFKKFLPKRFSDLNTLSDYMLSI